MSEAAIRHEKKLKMDFLEQHAKDERQRDRDRLRAEREERKKERDSVPTYMNS